MAYDNRLPSYESFLELHEVWLRAIALSWKDERFKKMLIEDTEKALQEYLNFKSPWNINIKVIKPEDSSAKWHPASDDKEGFWELPKDKFTYGLPPKPELPEDDEAIALAAYNDSGPGYLFTCC